MGPGPSPLGPLGENEELLAQRADQLAASLTALRAAVAGLDDRARHVEERATAAELSAQGTSRANRRAVIGMLVLAGIMLGMGWLVITNRDTVNRVDAVVTDLQDQQQQGLALRQLGLCPVFQSAIASDTPQARADFPAGPAAHDKLINNLKQAVGIMKCQPLDAATTPPGGH